LAAPPLRGPPTKARAELEEFAGVAEERTQRSHRQGARHASPTPRESGLVRDQPLVYQRVLPGDTGTSVEVRICPDLRVLVRNRSSDRILLTGRYALGAVTWDQHPSPAVPQTAQDMLTADVSDALRLFHRRYVDPRIWT
jgi:hypothetical protein